MVLLDVTTGLRRSELFALRWSDVDFWNLTIKINRSIFHGVLGNCKTEAARRPAPLSLNVAADLWLWKERTIYSKPDDWVFAPLGQGQQAILAQHSAKESHSTCGGARWHQEKNRLAYTPAYERFRHSALPRAFPFSSSPRQVEQKTERNILRA
jgi:integrase